MRKFDLDTLSMADSGISGSRLSLATISTREWDTVSIASVGIRNDSGRTTISTAGENIVSEHNIMYV